MFDENYSDLDVPINNISNCYEYFGLDPAIHYHGPKLSEIVIVACISAAVFAAAFVIVKGVRTKQPIHRGIAK